MASDAAACPAAAGVLLDSADSGPDVTLDAVWEAIDAVVPRSEPRAAVDNLTAALPPPTQNPAGEWRAELIERYAVVRSFVPQLAGRSSSGPRPRPSASSTPCASSPS